MKETSRATAAPTGRMVVDPAKVLPASDLLPWAVTGLPLRPFVGMWAFNPSIHFDGETWRCALRCSDYAMPDGVLIRSERARQGYVQTRNALATLDPKTWQASNVRQIRELDGVPRQQPCAVTGYEDMRIFSTTSGGLQGIAASLQLGGEGAPKHPEQVLLTFDAAGDVVEAAPIRGSWSNQPQKNWAPFDGTEEPRFLYSIDRGIVFDDRGPFSGWPEPQAPIQAQPKPSSHGGTEVVIRRKTISVPSGKTSTDRLGYGGLRGGSQLVRAGEGAWLGIGHGMRFIEGRKFYYHAFFTCDDRGVVLARSAPMKLAAEGIEFAAGLAIDGDRLVVSFGVDDMHCRIGVTSLAAVRETLVMEGLETQEPSKAPAPAAQASRVVAVRPSAWRPLTNAEVDTSGLMELRRAYIALRDRKEGPP
jgi:hypothetical protein